MTAPTHLNLAPGIYFDVSEETYHADLLCERPTLSRSEAVVLVDQSPRHCWAAHPRLNGSKEKDVTKEMDFGAAAHALCLGRGADIVTINAKDWRTDAAKEARDEARAKKMIPLLKKDVDRAATISGITQSRLKDFGLLEMFDDAKSEVVLVWEESDHCWCRAMADKLLIDEERKLAWFFDLKFTESAQPKWLPKHFGDQNYHVQESWYRRGLSKIRPDLSGRIKFVYFMQETEFPHAAVPVELNGEFQQIGLFKAERAIALWEQCIRTNNWPGYTDKAVTLQPTSWLLAEEMKAQALQSL